MLDFTPLPRRILLITGLSGAGKSTALRVLEDIGYETVDNPPLDLIPSLITPGNADLALGVDVRSRGFSPEAVLSLAETLRASTPDTIVELVYISASPEALLKRYSGSRRQHPLARNSPVAEGIAAEAVFLEPLHQKADFVLNTTDLPLPDLSRTVRDYFGSPEHRTPVLTLCSFSYAGGVPQEAGFVFDARFLRNPFYNERLKEKDGRDFEVGAYIKEDPDFSLFLEKITALLLFALPCFVREGRKYVTVAVGCSGGQHRSVFLIEQLALKLQAEGWHANVMHRELAHRQKTGGEPEQKAAAVGKIRKSGKENLP